ncbi:hypothetical protein QFZ71_004178 [Streptomyces sp. V2I9]|nr:hypothetical protein [Streptomyces sp. V2I9]
MGGPPGVLERLGLGAGQGHRPQVVARWEASSYEAV